MKLALELLDESIPDIRRILPSAAADTALERSIAARGVLQAITVRPEGNRYGIVLGRRRVRAARRAGLSEIEAEIRALTDEEAIEAQVIENMQRAALHPIDVWRAARQLLDAGSAIADAAMALGLDERGTRQVERLASLHPEVLKLVETSMPSQQDLRRIAAAPQDVQAKALKAPYARQGREVNWHIVAHACQQKVIARGIAIFDVEASRVVFEEDLFAAPGAPDQFVTRDANGFLQAQQAALKARVEAGRAKGERIVLAEWQAHRIAMPRGWMQRFDAVSKKALRGPTGPTRFVAVSEADRNFGAIEEAIADPPRALARQQARQAAKGKGAVALRQTGASTRPPGPAAGAGSAATSAGDEGAADQAEQAEPADVETGRSPITQRGLQLIAAAKTGALRGHLRTEGARRSPEILAACLVLALAGKNVRVEGGNSRWELTDFQDLALRLVNAGGDLVVPEDSLAEILAEALARMLVVQDPVTMHGSGDVAEWIGNALGADVALPRFDSAEMLATLSSSELRAIAVAAEVSTPKKVRELREALIGKAPAWRPTTFGAPGPKPEQKRHPRVPAGTAMMEDADA